MNITSEQYKLLSSKGYPNIENSNIHQYDVIR